MKKFVAIIACFLITSHLLAQDCTRYLYMQKNKTIEMTAFDTKGNVTFKSVSKVSDVNTSNGVTTATVVSDLYDKNGKSMGTSNVDYKCSGNGITMQMHYTDPKQQSKQTSALDIKVNNTSGDPEYPSDMKVGDHLKDYTSDVGIVSGTNTAVKVTDRMVVAKESITTPGGTWECFKITYKSSSQTSFTKSNSDTVNKVTSFLQKLKLKMPVSTSETTIWYNPDFGMIKMETKNSVLELTGVK
jgi:hypothetical protein